MKKTINSRRIEIVHYLLTLFISMVGAGDLFAQEVSISGSVIEPSGEPIPGVNILEKGSNNGTITDMDGNFSLMVNSEQSTLVFSFIGFENKEVIVGQNTQITVTMEPATDVLDEIVIVGYGTQKKVNMTGSVATINFSDDVSGRPITNVSSALAGLAAGVNVMQGSGQPGNDNATIRIRGTGTLNNSNPLVLVDGFEADMNNVNPNDIESISILKDAAASAIYGSRAANGVILITTKKGSDKPSFNYAGSYSIQSPVNTVEMVNDYARHMELINEGRENMQRPHQFSQTSIEAWRYAQENPQERKCVLS